MANPYELVANNSAAQHLLQMLESAPEDEKAIVAGMLHEQVAFDDALARYGVCGPLAAIAKKAYLTSIDPRIGVRDRGTLVKALADVGKLVKMAQEMEASRMGATLEGSPDDPEAQLLAAMSRGSLAAKHPRTTKRTP